MTHRETKKEAKSKRLGAVIAEYTNNKMENTESEAKLRE